MFVREKDSNPTIYTKAKTSPETNIIDSAYYKIVRLTDDYVVIPYDTGSTSGTMMSYDSQGNYFDLEMGMFEPDYAYGFKFLLKINCPLDTPHLCKTWYDLNMGQADVFDNKTLKCGVYCGFNCDKILENK